MERTPALPLTTLARAAPTILYSCAMSGETLAVLNHVSRSYGRRLAVDDMSFEIRRGEVLGLLGPNGAGKTSTMHMLCGVLAPGAGHPRRCRRS